MHLASLTDEELLSEFRFKRCPLTTTPMEEELAARLEAALDGVEDTEALEKQVEQLEEDKEALEDKLAGLKKIINE
jgi:vacuolar-type H+-ATPase subunit I/STV1